MISRLAQLANFIEEETFPDKEVVPKTYRNCLLLNFLVHGPVKLGAALFTNKHNQMQSDALVTVQKEHC